MNGCVYKTIDGKCLKYSSGTAISYCVDIPNEHISVSCEDRKPTNVDRLRQMTDEELAEWLVMVERRLIENALSKPFNYTDKQLKADWLEWLRQEDKNDVG